MMTRLSAGIVAMLVAASAAEAQKFRVEITAAFPPSAVKLLSQNSSEVDLKETDGLFEGNIPRPSKPLETVRYTLVASWPQKNETLYLRPSAVPTTEVIVVRMFALERPANLGTIQALEAKGQDLISTYETYFVARSIFRRMAYRYHAVTFRSARLWCVAAGRLAAAPDGIVAFDDEARQAVEWVNNRLQLAGEKLLYAC